jgi:uncharacterized protein involved in outer membrane biogenesis
VKWLLGAALTVAVLAALVLGAAAWFLPGVLASDAARARIESEAEAALGRALRYQRLEFGLLPPSVRVVAPAIAGATPEEPPLAEARRVSLRVALLPLLAGQLLIDGLVIDGATLRLRRSAAGFELPRPAGKPPKASEGGPPQEWTGAAPAEPVTTAEGELLPLAVRKLSLRDTTLILEDVAAQPPVIWELRELRGELRGEWPGEPLDVEASFALASGGSAELKGTATPDGEVDLELELDEVALAPATAYLGDGTQLAGLVSGELEMKGPARSPDRIAARLALRDADVRFDEISLRGPLRVEADLAGGLAAPSGSFDIDATQAELVYGRAFRKPAGTSATVSGRIVSGPGGLLGFDDLKLQVRDLDATAELSSGERMRIDVRASPFELAGWEALVPLLEGWQLAGRLAPGALAVERGPTELHGRIELDGIRAASPRGGALVLRGALLGEGSRVRSEGLELVAADQSVRVDAELVDLGAPEARWRLHFDARDADLSRLMAGFADGRTQLHGRLTTDGDLALPLDSGGDPLAALTGRVRLAIRDGWTSGRSLLKTSLDALIAVARPLDLLSRGVDAARSKRSADRFESVTGSFEIAGGFARTDDLRISEREHSIDLAGTLRLADLALDMRGKLTFADARDDEPGGVRRGIPLAHVGGTLGDPRVEVSGDAARSFAAALEPGRLGATLERAIGPESARELADGLGNLLDKATRKRR